MFFGLPDPHHPDPLVRGMDPRIRIRIRIRSKIAWIRKTDPGPGSGSGKNNPDHISKSLETIFRVKILKFFNADPRYLMAKIRMRDPGWKKFGSRINIPDPQHCLTGENTKSKANCRRI
jgi:hypothetical protein